MAEYVSGKYFVGKMTNDIRAVEDALTKRFREVNVISDTAEQREWNDKIETLSEGKNVVIFDEKNLPSIYFRMPVRTQDQIVKNGVNNVFETWLVDNAIISELYVAKYIAGKATVDSTDYAVSLRGLDPWCDINFDNAVAACTRKGTGHSLNTNVNWMQLVLDGIVNAGYQPHGNTNYCRYYYDSDERAEASYIYNNQAGRSKTGTGPNTWSHDGTPYGVFDLVGDVWEWTGGQRTIIDGEIQVLPNNDAMNSANSMAANSDKWKGIDATSGDYANAGADNNLCYDTGSGVLRLTKNSSKSGTNGSKDIDMKAMTAYDITVPNRAIRLGLYPYNTSVNGHVWSNTSQEDLSHRGGSFYNTSPAGVLALFLADTRTHSDLAIGFRSAFYRK